MSWYRAIFVQENEFENILYKMAVILSRLGVSMFCSVDISECLHFVLLTFSVNRYFDCQRFSLKKRFEKGNQMNLITIIAEYYISKRQVMKLALNNILNNRGQVTYILFSKLGHHWLNNSLRDGHQSIIWTSTCMLIIGSWRQISLKFESNCINYIQEN